MPKKIIDPNSEESLLAQIVYTKNDTPPMCKVCKALYIRWGGGFLAQEYCRVGHPKRASKILRGAIPVWVRQRIFAAYGTDVRGWMAAIEDKGKIPSRDTVEAFLLNDHQNKVTPGCLIGFIDHFGVDAQQNFICEPYARHCKACQKDAEAFAERIGADFKMTALTFHAPWRTNCIRLTFTEHGVIEDWKPSWRNSTE